MDEEITIQQAMKILNRSEPVVRGYIKSGKLSGEIKADGKYYMLRSDVEQMAKNPAQIQTDKLTAQLVKMSRQLEEMEARLKAVETRLETFTSLSAIQTPTYTPQPRRKRVERQETDVAASTTGNVPEGYVVYPHFLHGVPDSTAKAYVGEEAGPGKFTITIGSWKYGNHNVTKLLSPGQQHEYWQAMHNHQRFTACPDCPHEVAEQE